MHRATGFEFAGREWLEDGRTLWLQLRYRLGGRELIERIGFPGISRPRDKARRAALAEAGRLLHWLAGVSYWKATCDPEIGFAGGSPDAWQAGALESVYCEGLAEFAHGNRLDTSGWRGMFSTRVGPETRRHAAPLDLRDRALVPLGGGKDSLVALELLQSAGHECTVTAVRPAPLITAVAARTGCPWLPIARELAPGLRELNRRGAFNGHVPITAINAAVLLLAALLYDFDSIVFANEASADESSRPVECEGPINHQYSKSSAFERLLQEWIRRYIAADLDCFSLLRPWHELAVCRRFAALGHYHRVFSSCNRQFHLDGARSPSRWCGQCPKCLFVFLGLAPFMARGELVGLFGADLLDDASLVEDYAALCGLGDKPLECVGTTAESRAAMLHLAADESWRGAAVPEALAGTLAALETPPMTHFLQPGQVDLIPARYRALAV